MGTSLSQALNTAQSSLTSSQSQIAVVSNNISRADDINYHRQVALVSSNPTIVGEAGYYGTGASVYAITRSYDAALENSYRMSIASNGYMDVYASTISNMEELIGPNGTNALSDAIGAFQNSLQDASTTPESLTSRTSLIGEAENIADQINLQYENLRKLRDLTADTETGNGTLTESVNELNSLAEQLAAINDSIGTLEGDIYRDASANDLRDERDALLRSISELTEVTMVEHSDSRVSLYIGDYKLVDGTGYPESTIHTIHVEMDYSQDDVHGTPLVAWDDYNNSPVQLSEKKGSISAALDSRAEITEQMDLLYEYSQAVVNVVNSVLTTGHYPAESSTAYDLDGNPGVPLFSGASLQDGQPSEGEIISVIVTDPRKIALSDSPGETGNGDNGNMLWEVLNAPITDTDGDGEDNVESAIYKQSLSSYPDTYLGVLATKVSTAQSQANTAESTYLMFENSVLEQSGVNSDEELIRMMDIERKYQAAAKLMTTINEMLDVALQLV